MKKKTALTIAGSDSSGGAGIQADIKTMHGCGVYAMSAVTAITAQNTTGVKSILQMPANILADQLDMVFTDIFPDAVKIGMTFNKELAEVIAQKLEEYRAKNIVLDPVMVATSGARLMEEDEVETICQKLMPLATVITPNIPEAKVLLEKAGEYENKGCGEMTITNKEDMEKAARILSKVYNCAVLIKGGHLTEAGLSSDVLYTRDDRCTWFETERSDNTNTHGTGCTLSSAIASYLALGYDLEISIQKAKNYLTKSINQNLDLGKGHGPLWHIFEDTDK
ncbi:MAG: bifunctional hydroxymethylpyrimidine kinase/phosphomethylpyrimidine kinase [Butyrivibrio sp.]|nr:bifunctional hydroxymethylpyrimidine kinase/phosphomethylpyrimidine kinase [Butyrivibrio sp.]